MADDLDLALDKDSARELWLQLADQIRDAILSDRLGADKKMPSQDEMMGQLSIGRGTITRAYDALRAEGLVVFVRGKGAYTASAADIKRARSQARR